MLKQRDFRTNESQLILSSGLARLILVHATIGFSLLAFPPTACAHEVSLESQLNKLGARIADVQHSIEHIWLMLALTHATASVIGAGVTAMLAANDGRNIAGWFLVGVVAPVAAIPVLLVLSSRSRRRKSLLADGSMIRENDQMSS